MNAKVRKTETSEERAAFIQKFDEAIANVDKMLNRAEHYLADLDSRYDPEGDIDEMLKIQQAALSVDGRAAQLRVNRTELLNQKLEYCEDNVLQ